MGLAQIGEFSFIIASLGLTLKVTSDFLYPIAVAVSVLTTLTTPYLIRCSDSVVGWFDRKAPRSIVGLLDTYTSWVGQLQENRHENPALPMLRKWGWQIALNLLLVSAIFIVVVAMRGRAMAWWPAVPGGLNGLKALLWLVAMVLSLPLLIASFRKLQAMAMLISEVTVTREAAGERTAALRAVVSGTIVAAGCGGLILFVLLLSSTILPSRNALIVAALLAASAAIILWRSSIRLYSRAQIALRETLEEPPAAQPIEEPRPLPALLHEASLQMITIAEQTIAAGKVIGELRLRTDTGASIVGIEREAQNIINPGPDEEIMAGDRILLLGTKKQLESAEVLLTEKAS